MSTLNEIALDLHRNTPSARTPPSRFDVVRKAARLSSCVLFFSFAACSTFSGNDAPPPKESTKLDIAIEAAQDLNTDARGRGAPMLVRVYELRSELTFQDADFFALQNTDKAALGSDLLAVDQFILRPGESRHITRKSQADTTAIGVLAGYRDLPNAVWRVVYKMPPAPDASWTRAVIPANKAVLKVDLGATAIHLTDLEAAKPRFATETFKPGDQAPVNSLTQQVDAAVPKSGATK